MIEVPRSMRIQDAEVERKFQAWKCEQKNIRRAATRRRKTPRTFVWLIVGAAAVGIGMVGMWLIFWR